MRAEAANTAALVQELEVTKDEFKAFRTQVLFWYLLVNGASVMFAIQYANDKLVLGFIIGAVAVLNTFRFVFSTLFLLEHHVQARCTSTTSGGRAQRSLQTASSINEHDEAVRPLLPDAEQPPE